MKKVFSILLCILTLLIGSFLISCTSPSGSGNGNSGENSAGLNIKSENDVKLLEIGETVQLYVSGPNSNDVTWSCSNTDYATVTDNGLVTAKAEASSVVIKVTSNSDNSKYATFIFKIVKDKNESGDDDDEKINPDNNEFEYVFDSKKNEYSIKSVGSYKGNEILIPSTHDGYPVTQINSNAFKDTDITKVCLPSTLKAIKYGAFDNCKKLKRIEYYIENLDISSSYNTIFNDAGLEADELELYVGKNVKAIPNYLFYTDSSSASYLSKITFEEGSKCETIGKFSFYKCNKLKELILPENIKTLNSNSFGSCSNLELIEINSNIEKKYGDGPFENSGNRNNYLIVKFSDKVQEIPSYLFNNYDQFDFEKLNTSYIKKLIIGKNVFSIDDYAFANAQYLEQIDYYAENVEAVGAYAFNLAGKMNENGFTLNIMNTCKTVPSNITNYNYNVNLKNVVFEENSICQKIGDKAFYMCETLVNCVLPDSIEIIGESSFEGCNNYSTPIIPVNVKTIKKNAFKDVYFQNIIYNAKKLDRSSEDTYFIFQETAYYNYNLDTVTIGKTVESVPSYFICGRDYNLCTFNKLIFEEGINLKEIGNYAFSYAKPGIIMNFPDTVEIIGECGCAMLSAKGIKIPSSLKSIGKQAYYRCEDIDEIIIPEGVTEISDGAFSFTKGSKIVLHDKIKSIGEYAFRYTTAQNITVPTNVTFIGKGAFSNMNNLATAIVHADIDSISEELFYNDNNLKTLTIDFDKYTSIGKYAFGGCALNTFVMPDTVTSIGNYAFTKCPLQSISIPKNVETIGEGAFEDCKELVSVNFNDNKKLTVFENNIFCNCRLLKEMIIPESVKALKRLCLYDVNNLKKLTIPENVEIIESDSIFCSLDYELENNDNDYLVINFNAKNCALQIDNRDESDSIYIRTNFNNPNCIKIKIGNKVEKIPDCFTSNIPTIQEFTFEENSSCKVIGKKAFYYAKIGNKASNGAYPDFILPETIEEIGESAFYGMPSFIKVPASIKVVYPNAFVNCDLFDFDSSTDNYWYTKETLKSETEIKMTVDRSYGRTWNSQYKEPYSGYYWIKKVN